MLEDRADRCSSILRAAQAAAVGRLVILAQEALAALAAPRLAVTEQLGLAVLAVVGEPHMQRGLEPNLAAEVGVLACSVLALLGLVGREQRHLLLGRQETPMAAGVALAETLGLPSYPQHKISTIR